MLYYKQQQLQGTTLMSIIRELINPYYEKPAIRKSEIHVRWFRQHFKIRVQWLSLEGGITTDFGVVP
jgi:hypothetical protein